MAPAITADRLSKTFKVKVRDPGLKGALQALLKPRYRDVHAVRDVTFAIEPGEIVGFLGPNGAGKTTTLKMLAGLLYPTSGRVAVAGFAPWGGGPAFKRRIALVLGNRQQLVWDLPPEETFQLNRAIYDIAEPDYRERLAELVALLDRKSTRLNSSHSQISYAVFCLKKKKKIHISRCAQYTRRSGTLEPSVQVKPSSSRSR